MSDDEGGIGMDIVLDLNGMDLQGMSSSSELFSSSHLSHLSQEPKPPKREKKGEEQVFSDDEDVESSGGMWDNAGPFKLLPDELMDRIIPLLDVKSFSALTRSCRALYTVCFCQQVSFCLSLSPL